MALTFCLSEDRVPEEVGLRIALVTLCEQCPDHDVYVYRASPSAQFTEWIQQFRRVHLIPSAPPGSHTWNCKPHALLDLLDAGFPEVVWLDSDLLLARNCLPLFKDHSPEELIVAPEQASSAHQGSKLRTEGWGLELGRVFPVTINSCVIRVTRQHIPLLRRWKEMLDDPTYFHFQSRPMSERPLHMLSDQDAFNAVLGSQEFAHVPVTFLRRGLDIIHSGGALAYSFSERMRGISNPVPPFVHGQGAKPWIMFDRSVGLTGWFWFYRRLLMEVSPYISLARAYRSRLGVPCPWMDHQSTLGRMCRVAGFGHFAIRGLPLTAAASLLRAMPTSLAK